MHDISTRHSGRLSRHGTPGRIVDTKNLCKKIAKVTFDALENIKHFEKKRSMRTASKFRVNYLNRTVLNRIDDFSCDDVSEGEDSP